ncbi:MAG: DegT/DnrJ/EryC1/StrS family aminotransferase [Phycisphaerales bacterium]
MGQPTSEPAFATPRLVGRPNPIDRDRLFSRLSEMLDRRWYSNNGPLVQEFEQAVSSLVGVEHCIATCNATVAMELAARALHLSGEVIVPAFTFVATAHALDWLGLRPVFADIDPNTHNLDPTRIEKLITPRTSGIVGVHVWGRSCDTDAIGGIAAKHGLRTIYDAAHAFGCSRGSRPIGGCGDCEIFSFHATKYVQSFEGGMISTNDGTLAERLRLMRNFGFAGVDRIVSAGTNAKMSEANAAMGLTSLEAMPSILETNRRNHVAYREGLRGVLGVDLMEYDVGALNNHQYVVLAIDPVRYGATRDALAEHLGAHRVIARRYFTPPLHRVPPYRDRPHDETPSLPNAERVSDRVLVLPTGSQMDAADVAIVCRLIRDFASRHVSETDS